VHNLATLVRDDDFSCGRCAPIFGQFLGYQSRAPTSCLVVGGICFWEKEWIPSKRSGGPP
jgi:hypothetical protein